MTLEKGWLGWDQFMRAALYHPDFGYYTAKIRDIGRRGDFSTSAHPQSILAQAIARWATGQKSRLGCGRRWNLIEIGGGNGEMAAGILTSLGLWARLGLTYHLVEISSPLRERQKQKLRDRRVIWHDTIEDALRATDGVALVFSNEAVDAFPCRRFVCEGNLWFESGVTLKSRRLEEMLVPLSETEMANLQSSAFHTTGSCLRQSVEVHAEYREFLEKLTGRMRRGCLLTIDYGDRWPAVYHRQPNGTVRGYFHHQRVDGSDLLLRIGQQDITADVNFTDLENWGSALGFRNERFETQRDFILRNVGPVAPSTTDQARILDPVGAGSAFKVLQQSFQLN